MSYRTRIRQLSCANPKEPNWTVEVYLAGAGWLPLADASGRKVAVFASRKAARGHAGLVIEREQILGSRYVI